MKESKLILALLCIATMAGAQTSFYVPGGLSGILTSPNGNLGIGMTPVSHAALAVSSGVIGPLDMHTNQASFKFGGHLFSLAAGATFANVPYIEWRTADGTRQAYLGWRPEVFTLRLENNFNFLIDGGRVGIGAPTPSATLDIKSDIVSEPNTETSVINVRSRPGTGMADNLFQLNQAVGDQTSTTYAILRMGNQFNNGAVPNQIVLNTNGPSWFNGGNVGIGTTAPSDERLTVNGAIRIPAASTTDNDSPAIIYKSDDDFLYDGEYINQYAFGFHRFDDGLGSEGVNAYVAGYYGVDFFTNGLSRFRISKNGNIGIGTTTPTEKLTVNGTIYSKEVKVDLSVPGPDYVFEKDYPLPTLEEVKKFIEEHKHLPEVPSALQLEAEGVNVGEMNMILLRKVEELTLYVIEQHKLIAQLRDERAASAEASEKMLLELTQLLGRQQAEIDALKKQINNTH